MAAAILISPVSYCGLSATVLAVRIRTVYNEQIDRDESKSFMVGNLMRRQYSY